ncbi:ubiquinone biosynthesis protein UbiJ [Izhakiella capsodis]|uniref:Ubiquinone biosynthesis accessory factor UbiJ n=1 Tax=Izhakiella capsodis TaxID=1367852 RepID=A0A1I4ZKS3_9GAMM|nr:SCP2 domain-containing protein [Izhakiella capsodis]SFN50560.1 ubiquinone biosynthesis protein UbiJ [Izhakiella capsodis]
MTIMPLLTAGLETVFNYVFYRDRGLKSARQRLAGRSLSLELQGLSHPLILLFSEHQVDVISVWEDQADCRVHTRLSTLKKLRDRQQLSVLIRSGELKVDGDLQVVQQFSALIDLAEFDPAEYLAPWMGDVAAHGLGVILKKNLAFLGRDAARKKRYLSETITEEWRLAPGGLEAAWFADEVESIERHLLDLDARLNKLEAQ